LSTIVVKIGVLSTIVAGAGSFLGRDKGGRLRPPLYLSAITLLKNGFFERKTAILKKMKKIVIFSFFVNN
jgi:hypothetical protein